jgi:hypothetical protein
MKIYLMLQRSPRFMLSRRHWSVRYLNTFNENLEKGSGCKKLLEVWENLDEVIG